LAAAALIGWTMLPLPATLTLRPGELLWDPGPWALKIFTRCTELDRTRRDTMLGNGGDGERPGLLDCYRLAAWSQVIAAALPEAEDLEARSPEKE
jgi:hypothetical protein